jgi:pimeloyl-ACP methyl ester carboxylesterase
MHGRGSGGRTRSGSGAVEQCHHAGMLPRRGYVDSPWGQLHHVRAGSGRTLLLLHQTPRSADEFAELVPLLAARFDVIAMDMVGFGASADAPAQTIDVLAGAAIALLDALGVTTSAVLGHHTGAVVALELAASAPRRIDALVLSAPPWVDAAARAARAAAPIPVDTAARREDGGHLLALWDQRRPYYPPPAAALLDRYVRDALRPGLDPTAGHRAVGEYRMEQRIGLVRAPVLLLGAQADPFSFPHLNDVRHALRAARAVRTHVVAGGTVALMEQCASEVAAVVEAFLTNDTARGASPLSLRSSDHA